MILLIICMLKSIQARIKATAGPRSYDHMTRALFRAHSANFTIKRLNIYQKLV